MDNKIFFLYFVKFLDVRIKKLIYKEKIFKEVCIMLMKLVLV